MNSKRLARKHFHYSIQKFLYIFRKVIKYSTRSGILDGLFRRELYDIFTLLFHTIKKKLQFYLKKIFFFCILRIKLRDYYGSYCYKIYELKLLAVNKKKMGIIDVIERNQ